MFTSTSYFRGLDKPDFYELSSEVTFYYSDFKDSLQLTDTYLVDPLLLFQNKYNPEYDPRQSVVKINEYQPEFNQNKSKTIYRLLFFKNERWKTIQNTQKYTRGLSKRDKQKQLKNIRTAKKAYKNKNIDRPKLKATKIKQEVGQKNLNKNMEILQK